jgi:hypothetical protein
MASSMRRLNRLRNTKERRMIADETNNNKNNVARKVNLYDYSPPPKKKESQRENGIVCMVEDRVKGK